MNKLRQFIINLPGLTEEEKQEILNRPETEPLTEEIKPLTDKQKTLFLLMGYEQWHIDSYQDQWNNNFYGDDPISFEDYVDDIEWEQSEEFANIMQWSEDND